MNSYLLEEQKNKEYPVSAFLLYTFVVCVAYILPLFKFVLPYIIAAPLMLATLLPFVFKKMPWTSHAILGCFMFLILALISILAGGSPSPVDAINNVLIRNVRFFLPILWGCFALKYTNKKQQTVFLVLFGILITFIFIKTLIALEIDPWIARILAQGKESTDAEVNQYRLDNIGGFEFSYMMGIIALCFTWAALKVKSIWVKILSVGIVVLIFYYIIETMYTTLLLLTFMGVFLLLFLNIKSPIVRLSLIALAVVAVFFIAPILEYLSTAFPEDSLLNTKFENFYFAVTKADIGEVGSRPEKIMHSFERWLEAPIFGSYDTKSNSHSLILSTLETGGIVGFIPWISVFFVGYGLLKKEFESRGVETELMLVSFLFVVLLSFFNPIGYVFEVTIAAFFVVPIWSNLLKSSKLGA